MSTFNALAIETRDGVVLIDTGLGEGAGSAAGHLPASLAAAGIDAAAVSSVVISHFRGDPVGGLRGPDGTPAFPNAEVLVPEMERNFWMGDAAVLPDAFKGTGAADHLRLPFFHAPLPGDGPRHRGRRRVRLRPGAVDDVLTRPRESPCGRSLTGPGVTRGLAPSRSGGG
ncbi:MBL fold metallo-hydrolase [Lichenibacterium minor]|nr:MBL fold metallo-hydrolase [Lichenibacterium minor]